MRLQLSNFYLTQMHKDGECLLMRFIRRTSVKDSEAAQAEFMTSLINVPDTPYPSDLNERISGNVDFLFRHEFKAFFRYLPNIESIRNHNVKMVTATGRDSDDAYYVQATRALAG